MLDHTPCEICGEDDWQVLGRRTYTRSQGADQSPYLRTRLQVLFDVWLRGEDRVTLTSVLCRKCGFVIYLPRPQEEDIDRKYAFLGSSAREDEPGQSPAVAERRSGSMFRYLAGRVRMRNVRSILDYGGGDGSLMLAFRRAGKQCYVVDYNRNTVEGVTKLADTLDGLDPAERFDAILCSHVMEHVAQPLKALRRLVSHLRRGGRLFIEVPMGVWRHPPLEDEPVTHINFFTPSSVHNLLVLGGLAVRTCELAAFLDATGTRRHGIRAIAGKQAASAAAARRLRPPDAMAYLKPSILGILRFYRLVPESIPPVIQGKLRHLARWP